MIFTTWAIGILFWVSLAVYWLSPQAYRKAILIVSGLLCYVWAIPIHTLAIVGLSLITYALGEFALEKGVDSRAGRTALISGIVLSVLVLVGFKYTGFLLDTVNQAFSQAIPLPNLLIPLGISFFVFEFIHYLSDIWRGLIRRAELDDYMAFILFFPTMVSGPIKRFQVFADQLNAPKHLQTAYFNAGLGRIIIGLFKKIVIADTMTPFIEPLLRPNDQFSGSLALAVVAYTIKIYIDFSAYTDIAIGATTMFGLSVPENFEQPYLTRNIQKFWNKWHMSLSSWIRDYVFFPLGGSRVSKPRMFLNFILVMAICGLWHGANYNFLVWGLWNGFGLAVHRAWTMAVQITDNGVIAFSSWVLNMVFVMIGWVLFAAPNLPTAMANLRALIPGL